MSMRSSISAAIVALLLFASTAASATDYYVDITNRTGYTILRIYVSPAKSTKWEEDVLGSEILPNGQSRRITLRGYDSSIFDIRLVDTDGDTYTYWKVDVLRRDIEATIADLDSKD